MKSISNTKLSILDLAMVAEGRTASDTFANSTELAQHAEKLGYLRYWFAEHHNMEGIASSATSILIGHIANATTTLRVGSGGIMLPNHAPLVIAEQFGTLATLFPNRIDLGLGRAPGSDQLTAAALRRDQRAVMDFGGSIKELQKYLSADNRKSSVRAIPGEGLYIPIWILGSSTDSAFLAAEMGLPYAFASHFAPAQLLDAVTIYRRNFKKSLQLSAPYFMPCINVIAAETDTRASLLANSFKKLFLGILTGNRKKLAAPNDEIFEPNEEAALQQMIRYSFIGSKKKIEMELQRFLDITQADELMINSPIFSPADRLKSYEIASSISER